MFFYHLFCNFLFGFYHLFYHLTVIYIRLFCDVYIHLFTFYIHFFIPLWHRDLQDELISSEGRSF